MHKTISQYRYALRHKHGATKVVSAVMILLLAASLANAGAPDAPAPIRGDNYTVLWENHDPQLLIDRGTITIYLGRPQDPTLVAASDELASVLDSGKDLLRRSAEILQRNLATCGWNSRTTFGWLAEDGLRRAHCVQSAMDDHKKVAFAYFNGMISALQSPFYDDRLIPADRNYALSNLYRGLAHAQTLTNMNSAGSIYLEVAKFMAGKNLKEDPSSTAGIRLNDEREAFLIKSWQESVELSQRSVLLQAKRIAQYEKCSMEGRDAPHDEHPALSNPMDSPTP